MEIVWYYAKNGTRCGPVDTATLHTLAASQQLTPTDLVWREGFKDWVPAAQVEGLFATSAATIPPPLPEGLSPRDGLPTSQTKPPQVEKKKSKRIPGYVWIIVGAVVVLLAIPFTCILAAIIIPQFMNASSEASASSTQTTLSTARAQIELFKLQHDDYYPNLTASTNGAQAWGPMLIKTDTTTVSGTTAVSTGKFGPYFTVPPTNALNRKSGIVIGDLDTLDAYGTPNAGWVWDSTDGKLKAIVPLDWPVGKAPYAPGTTILDTKYTEDFTK